MGSRIITNFMRQQGFASEGAAACDLHFAGLQFQPSIVFPLVLVATAAQLPLLFVAISAVLWWNTAVPRWNPFELLYNRLVARPRGRPVLGPAPAPRRTAQGMAATFTLGAALALWAGFSLLAWAFELLLAIAFVALLLGRFCLGAYVYHVFRGHLVFANATLPWARGAIK